MFYYDNAQDHLVFAKPMDNSTFSRTYRRNDLIKNPPGQPGQFIEGYDVVYIASYESPYRFAHTWVAKHFLDTNFKLIKNPPLDDYLVFQHYVPIPPEPPVPVFTNPELVDVIWETPQVIHIIYKEPVAWDVIDLVSITQDGVAIPQEELLIAFYTYHCELDKAMKHIGVHLENQPDLNKSLTVTIQGQELYSPNALTGQLEERTIVYQDPAARPTINTLFLSDEEPSRILLAFKANGETQQALLPNSNLSKRVAELVTGNGTRYQCQEFDFYYAEAVTYNALKFAIDPKDFDGQYLDFHLGAGCYVDDLGRECLDEIIPIARPVVVHPFVNGWWRRASNKIAYRFNEPVFPVAPQVTANGIPAVSIATFTIEGEIWYEATFANPVDVYVVNTYSVLANSYSNASELRNTGDTIDYAADTPPSELPPVPENFFYEQDPNTGVLRVSCKWDKSVLAVTPDIKVIQNDITYPFLTRQENVYVPYLNALCSVWTFSSSIATLNPYDLVIEANSYKSTPQNVPNNKLTFHNN